MFFCEISSSPPLKRSASKKVFYIIRIYWGWWDEPAIRRGLPQVPKSGVEKIVLINEIGDWTLTQHIIIFVFPFVSSVRSSNGHPDLLVTQQQHPHFFRSHRSSTLDFHFLSHYSYIKAIMLYIKAKLGKTLAYSGILWHTLAFSGIVWHSLA